MRILAHRGAPTCAASNALLPVENTVAAVLSGLAAGADGAEIDLRLSADGVLVVTHDPDLVRIAACPLAVATSTWLQLRAAALAAGVELARAEDVLAALAGRVVVLELKAPPTAAGAVRRTAQVVVELLADVRQRQPGTEVTVSSFAPALVEQVRALSEGLDRTALLGRPLARPSSVLRQALAAGHDEIHPHVGALLAQPSCVRAAHACGVAVVPWTVNRGRAVRRLGSLGVDGVITDVPAGVRAALAGRSLAA